MSAWGMVAIGLIYGYCSFDQFKLGNIGLGCCYLGWAFGQMGMAYAVYKP